MKDVMIDIESLGNGKHCCIVQIGACFFDRKTGEIGGTFQVNIDAASEIKAGAEMDASTVYWWLSQSKEAQNSILAEPRVSIMQALADLNDFLKDAKCIWSHATFDFVAITEAYRRVNLKPSFRYSAARDIRTLVDMFNIAIDKTERTGLHHNGLADAIHQVKYCMKAFSQYEQLKSAKQLISYVKGNFDEKG